MTVLSLLCIFTSVVGAQTAAPIELTLSKALEQSLKSYPSVRVSQEQVNAAGAAIQLARTAYLPRIDALAQFNRATRNNVFGLLLPQNVIPSMSGPVIGTNNLGSVWGSAVGVLVTWEPFDFGLRRANVSTANAAREQSEATVKRTQFDVVVATAGAFLTVVAAGQTVQAAQAGVDRTETLVKIVTAQVSAQLRPGADESRAQAESAAARTQLVQAQEALDVSLATLAQFVGGDPAQLAVSAGGLLRLPPETKPGTQNTAANPVAVEQSAVVEQARAQLRALERTYFPRFSLQGAAYSRGTGAELDGQRSGGLNGLAPNVQDYAIGFSVMFPILDLPALHAREAAQTATIREQVAKSEQIAVDLRAQWNRAVAAFNGARRIAGNTPIQVAAARMATDQATARYKAGLANIDELAEAQRLLTQAEIDDVLARLGIWRGLLGIAAAAGDIEPFVLEAMQ